MAAYFIYKKTTYHRDGGLSFQKDLTNDFLLKCENESLTLNVLNSFPIYSF